MKLGPKIVHQELKKKDSVKSTSHISWIQTLFSLQTVLTLLRYTEAITTLQHLILMDRSTPGAVVNLDVSAI